VLPPTRVTDGREPALTVFDFFGDPDNFSLARPEKIQFKDVVLTEEGVGARYT
jgi:hypothetical protein